MNDLTQSFFLIIPLGMEKISLEELKEKWNLHFQEKLPSVSLTTGGIELATSLEKGLALNLILKIPTRILLRIEKFKCRDFPKLYKKILKINWSHYLPGTSPKINSSSKNSRIFDSRKIEKCFVDAISKYFIMQPPKKKYLEQGHSLNLFIRLENDECTVSIDTSGAPLYKRGIKLWSAKAPIRENLAAGLLYLVKQNHQKTPSSLIDPMCGSGTFLVESRTFYHLNNQRKFDFYNFPLSQSMKMPTLRSIQSGLFDNHLGIDIDEKNIMASQDSLKKMDISVFQGDAFEKIKIKMSNNVVIVNPPYGKRIKKIPNYKLLIKNILDNFSPCLIGIIIPATININLGSKITFKNGGIKVNFWYFKP